MKPLVIVVFMVALASCQTHKAAQPKDLIMTQDDLIQQEIDLTPPLELLPQCGPHEIIEKVLI